MKLTNWLYLFLFVALLFSGSVNMAAAASSSEWAVTKPSADLPLYRQDFPINIQNADGTVYKSFSMEIPTGWKILKDGLGYMITQPVPQRHSIVPKIEFQCLPGDTYKIFFEKEKENADTAAELFNFDGFKVLRRYFSPYPGNKKFKTLALSVFKNNFTLRISTYAEDEEQIAPMIPIVEWAARSIKLSSTDTGPFKIADDSAGSGSSQAPNTPVQIDKSNPGNDSTPVIAHPSESQKTPTKGQSASSLNPDQVGASEAFQGDGTPDTRVYVRTLLSRAQLKSMTLRNTDGVYSIWDTIPGNGMWIMGVNMQQGNGSYVNLNNADGSLKSVTADGEVLFELRLHDSGAISGKQTNYQFEIELIDGQKIVKNLAAAELGNIPAASAGTPQVGALAQSVIAGAFKIAATSFIPPHASINSVGPGEGIQPDAFPDARLSVELFAAGKTLVNVEVRNVDGAFSVWDTIPNNGMWGLGVFVKESDRNGMTQLNNSDSSLRSYLIKDSPVTFELRMCDAGSLNDRSTNFKVNFVFSDGTNLSSNVGKPQY